MLKIIYSPSDAALSERIMADLRNAGYPIEDLRNRDAVQNSKDVLIAVLSEKANNDATTHNLLIRALDNGQHIIPVLAESTEIPKLINHLPVLDFSSGYDFAALRSQVDALLLPDAPQPLRVLTPTVKRSNRTVGILLGLLALFWFAAGLYGVGVLGLQAPADEYNAVDTEVALTQAFFINPELDRYGLFLPDTTEEAQNYQSTLRAVPTVYRPFAAETATSYALGTPVATNDMSTLTPTPES